MAINNPLLSIIWSGIKLIFGIGGGTSTTHQVQTRRSSNSSSGLDLAKVTDAIQYLIVAPIRLVTWLFISFPLELIKKGDINGGSRTTTTHHSTGRMNALFANYGNDTGGDEKKHMNTSTSATNNILIEEPKGLQRMTSLTLENQWKLRNIKKSTKDINENTSIVNNDILSLILSFCSIYELLHAGVLVNKRWYHQIVMNSGVPFTSKHMISMNSIEAYQFFITHQNLHSISINHKILSNSVEYETLSNTSTQVHHLSLPIQYYPYFFASSYQWFRGGKSSFQSLKSLTLDITSSDDLILLYKSLTYSPIYDTVFQPVTTQNIESRYASIFHLLLYNMFNSTSSHYNYLYKTIPLSKARLANQLYTLEDIHVHIKSCIYTPQLIKDLQGILNSKPSSVGDVQVGEEIPDITGIVMKQQYDVPGVDGDDGRSVVFDFTSTKNKNKHMVISVDKYL